MTHISGILHSVLSGNLADAKDALREMFHARAANLVAARRNNVVVALQEDTAVPPPKKKKSALTNDDVKTYMDIVEQIFPVDYHLQKVSDTKKIITLYRWILKHESALPIVETQGTGLPDDSPIDADSVLLALKGAFYAAIKKLSHDSPLRELVTKSRKTPGGYAFENDVLEHQEELFEFFRIVKKVFLSKLKDEANT